MNSNDGKVIYNEIRFKKMIKGNNKEILDISAIILI